MKNRDGFTLIEILAIIVILSILLFIGIVSYKNITEKSKMKAFFVSVSNIVNSIKIENIIDEKDFCMYNYDDDTKNKTDSIKSMYVLVHKKNNKIIYSVYATRNEKEVAIDVYDFNKLDMDNVSKWKTTSYDENSYTKYATSLITSSESDSNDLFNYKICDVK